MGNEESVYRSLSFEERVVLFGLGTGDVGFSTRSCIQKTVYIAGKELPDLIGKAFEFVPMENGPYCAAIDKALDTLRNRGLLAMNERGLSDLGHKVRALVRLKAGGAADALKAAKDLVLGCSADEILLYMFETYPECRVESRYSELRGQAPRLFASMVRKRKISADRGAELSGLSRADFDRLI